MKFDVPKLVDMRLGNAQIDSKHPQNSK